jgi:hypothetical protein
VRDKKRNQPRRNKVKYPGFSKKYTTRIRQEYLDIDYVDQLNEAERAWMNKFIEEELNTQFQNDGTDFNQTKQERKKIYDRNNKQNSDLYGNLKNKGNKFGSKKLLNYDNVIEHVEDEFQRWHPDPKHIENSYIDFIEIKQLEEMMKEYETAMRSFTEISQDQQQWQQALLSPQESSDP